MYEAEESPTLLGHVEVFQPKPAWNSQTICPLRSVKPGDRFMSVVGTGGVSFAVDLSQNPSEIMLNVPQTVHVKSTKAIVLQFNPPKDISDRQLDITVTSPSDTPAYLKVSHIRKDVDENIEVVDYRKKSLRLSFAKKGRITLSKVSDPPLTDSTSSWFIGIALKNSTGSLKHSESKFVTLKLSQSFDYSYATPICTLFFVSLLGGILVSCLALCLFKEYLVVVYSPGTPVNVSNRDQDNQPSNNSLFNRCVCAIVKFGTFIVAMMKVVYSCWFSGGPKTYSYATGVVGFVLMIGACQFVIENWYVMIQEGDRDDCYYNDLCYRVSDYHDIPLNLMISNLTYIVHALILAVCVLYMETKLNLFCENLEKSVTSGDQGPEPSNEQENCNNGDNRQSTPPGCQGEALPNHLFVCPNITPHLPEGTVPVHKLGDKEKKALIARALKKKYSYSIGYAFAWALLFEGLFSLLYHLCPSRYTFQFDSAFMFVIAGLTVVLVYNGMELSECTVNQAKQQPEKQRQVEAHSGEQHPVEAHSGGQHPVEAHSGEQHPVEAHSGEQHPVEAHSGEQHPVEKHSEEDQPVQQYPVEELPVGALNFFLYFIVPLYIFNYIGTLYHSKSGLAIGLQVVFFISLFFWWLAMGLWAFHKLKRRKGVLSLGKCERNTAEMRRNQRCNACWYIFGCVIVPPALFVPIFLFMDLSHVFLFTCIAESVWAVSAKAELHQNLLALLRCQCKCTCNCNCTRSELFGFFQGFYISLSVSVLAGAFCVFLFLATTDKTASPEDSRNRNKECAVLGFFDWHDLWHFLSSFGLLMGAFVIMFLSAEPKNGKTAKTARRNGVEKKRKETGEDNAGCQDAIV